MPLRDHVIKDRQLEKLLEGLVFGLKTKQEHSDVQVKISKIACTSNGLKKSYIVSKNWSAEPIEHKNLHPP